MHSMLASCSSMLPGAHMQGPSCSAANGCRPHMLSVAPQHIKSKLACQAAASGRGTSPDSFDKASPKQNQSKAAPNSQGGGSAQDPISDTTGTPGRRAPRAQRQLFRALEQLRTGSDSPSTESAAPGPKKPAGGKGVAKKPAPQQQQRGPGAPQNRRRATPSEPDDVIVLGAASRAARPAGKPTGPAVAATAAAATTAAATAAAATTAAAAATAAAAPAPAAASSQVPFPRRMPAAEDDDGDDIQVPWNIHPSDGEDGAQLWRDRLAEVGWEYDEDEEDEEGESEGEEGEMMDDDQRPEVPEDLLLEATPYGTWFAGEGQQPEETAEQLQLRQWYTEKGFLPPAQWGPIKATMLQGKGRGLVATKKLSSGDMILVSRPLHLLEDALPEEQQGDVGPENEELADEILKRSKLSAAQHLWLKELLMADMPTDDSASYPRLPTTQEVQALQQPAGPFTAIDKKDAAVKETLYRLVNLNCLGEEFKEVAASSLREEEADGWLGLFPDASHINHSCAPNALYWVLGERLVVRAAEDIEAGQEVTLSYLGALLTAPLSKRQAELQDKWGFTCACIRCKAEAAVAGPGSDLGQVVDQTYQWCQDMSEVLQSALEDEDYSEVADIRRDLLAKRDEVEAAIRAAKPSSRARRWLQASIYDLYDMLSLCADEDSSLQKASGKSGGRQGQAGRGQQATNPEDEVLDTEQLAVCARLLESVSRGSDAQAYLAAEYMVRAGVRFGANHHEALEARRMCKAAFTARFGPVSPALMDQLVSARLDD